MRFKHAPRPRPVDQKTVRRFLLFPKRIGSETRWLEITGIVYECIRYNLDGFGNIGLEWKAVAWGDE